MQRPPHCAGGRIQALSKVGCCVFTDTLYGQMLSHHFLDGAFTIDPSYIEQHLAYEWQQNQDAYGMRVLSSPIQEDSIWMNGPPTWTYLALALGKRRFGAALLELLGSLPAALGSTERARDDAPLSAPTLPAAPGSWPGARDGAPLSAPALAAVLPASAAGSLATAAGEPGELAGF